MVTTAKVSDLWRENNDAWWGLGDEDTPVTLQMLYDDYFYTSALTLLEDEARERMDFNFRLDLKQHRDSLKHKLEIIAAQEPPRLPEEWAILLQGEGFDIEDGNHRLVACKILGIEEVPVIYGTDL